MTHDDPEEPGLALPASYGVALMTLLALGTTLATFMAQARPVVPVDVRFCNGTDAAVLALESSTTRFGDIAIGKCSQYHRLEQSVYSRISFSAEWRGARLQSHLEDHAGERALAQGRYTFVVRDGAAGPGAMLQQTPG